MHDVQPLGDTAVLATFPSEADAANFARAVQAAGWPWVIDLVPAYLRVAVFHDAALIDWDTAATSLATLPLKTTFSRNERVATIPCCYELGPDMDVVVTHARLAPAEVIALHTATEYTIYAIGFCPGFPYLGYLTSALQGMPRLATPRLRVEPGSVGLTGRQTGIYPLARPGGWPLIGRTPLTLVDVATGYFPLSVGDRVRFVAIDVAEYEARFGERLTP